MRVVATGVGLMVMALACSGGGGGMTPESQPMPTAKACPFEFPAVSAVREPGEQPSLLAVPVFHADGPNFEMQNGTGGRGILGWQSIHPFEEGGRSNRGANITYLQPFVGLSVLHHPSDAKAELERTSANAQSMSEAKTETKTLSLQGTDVAAVIQTSASSKLATLLVPVFDGEFLAPVTVGVYTTVAGCDATMETAFTAMMKGLQLRNDNEVYEKNPIVLDYVKQKRASKKP